MQKHSASPWTSAHNFASLRKSAPVIPSQHELLYHINFSFRLIHCHQKHRNLQQHFKKNPPYFIERIDQSEQHQNKSDDKI
uniref:Ovule protein n=1 Tax=Ascaris lumbricoides TaxID=6252 RepID=A0A0M3IND3_ASCLU